MERERTERQDRPERSERPAYGNKKARKKVCVFCADKTDYIDYKELSKLRRFLSERGKIVPRRVTGTCAKHQRAMTVAIKRARHLALMPYANEN
ncbi:MAG: 30S ribosomal protein S18 [Oscillospiraceae bacterium]|nr:30S ribosomal protein S18 [Oscillospiraceae bacterium]